MKGGLTKKQQDILDFISEFQRRHQMSPTITEVAERFRIAGPTAFAHIRALKQKGFIDRSSKARSLLLTRDNTPKHLSVTLSIPILGRISAGLPLLAQQNIEDTITLDPGMLPWGVGGQRLYGLKIKGDSMRDKGILDGDVVIAREQSSANIGDIVVALVDDEATVKSFYLANEKVELRPANPDCESQFYDYNQVTIQGIIIALYRKYNGVTT